MIDLDTIYRILKSPTFNSIVAGITVAIITSVINYFLIKRRYITESRRERKIKAYGEFLEKAKGFLNDPCTSKDDSLILQKKFIKKYYNEIWISGSEEVIKAVNDFFNSVSISYANEDQKTKALRELTLKIREDLGLKASNELKNSFRFYSPNIKQLEKEKPK